uniref:transposase family protein n=2 Tax=Okeania TaxID=1458928 RepID=UPI0023D96D75
PSIYRAFPWSRTSNYGWHKTTSAATNSPRKTKTELFGKKKRHTRKHLAAVDQNKRVLILTQAREGKLHDQKFHDQQKVIGNIPLEIPIEVDSGFQGLHSPV